MPESPRGPNPDQDPLASLAGIDARIGRASTNGNDALYRRLLLKFHSTQGAAFEASFATALQSGDDRTATRLAHDMRAVAGSLGMKALELAASRLEAAFSAGAAPEPEVIAPLLAAVSGELALVQQSLAALSA